MGNTHINDGTLYISFNKSFSLSDDYPISSLLLSVKQIGSLRILPVAKGVASPHTKIYSTEQAEDYIQKEYRYPLDKIYVRMLVHSQSDECDRKNDKQCFTCNIYMQSFMNEMGNFLHNGSSNDYIDSVFRWLLYVDYGVSHITQYFVKLNKIHFNKSPYVIFNSINYRIDDKPNIIELCTPVKKNYLMDDPDRIEFNNIVRNEFFLLGKRIEEEKIKRFTQDFYKHMPDAYELGVML